MDNDMTYVDILVIIAIVIIIKIVISVIISGGTLRQDNCQLIGQSFIVLARQAQKDRYSADIVLVQEQRRYLCLR